MKKSISILIAIILFNFSMISPSLFVSAKYEMPPLPEEEKKDSGLQEIQKLKHRLHSTPRDNEETAIVMLEEKADKAKVQSLLKPFPKLKLGYIYEHAINGFSVKGPKEEIKKLKTIGTVQDIQASYQYKLQVQKLLDTNSNPTHNSIEYIGTEEVRHILDQKGNNLTGKGIKVGIIDTGIDYTHPDLSSAYKEGYDFIDHDSDPMETRNAGPYNTFHGSHVAGVIAAKGRMTGIAPDAEIYAYRALGPGGYGTTEQIIAAIDRAIKDKVDVLNLSLGISINGPDLPVSLALDSAVKHNIVAVTSNGNSGPNLWTVGSPGTSHRAISVGASTPQLQIPYLDYFQQQFRLTPLHGSAPWKNDRSYPIVDGKLGRQKDIKDASGKLVLVKRGKLTFTEKVDNAIKAGAIGVIIYNNTEGELLAELEKEFAIPVAAITKKDGEKLLKLIKTKQSLGQIVQKHEEDYLASFSSRGPVTYTWEIKPDVVAPGVAIISTVPGGYMPLQGTSMASPHVAGASALLKQAHPDWTPEQIKAVLMNTSKPLINEDNHLYQSFEQGAGRVQLQEALKANSIVQPGSLLYGKAHGTIFEERKRTLTVENISNHTVHYTFATPEHSEYINWDFPEPFFLKPGEQRKISITMEIKANHPKNEIFNGYIEMKANQQTIAIPYLYVVNEPNYPRIMSFSFGEADRENQYEYNVYLPGGADEFGIAIFDADTHKFIEYIEWDRKVNRGLVTKTIKIDNSIPSGVYLAVAFAKKEGKEDYLEQIIEIRE